MDFCDATIVVLNRIKKIEPDNAQKIVRYLLLHNSGDEEMIRMAFGPDHLINSFIHRAKMELTHSLPPPFFSRPIHFQPLQHLTTFQSSQSYWDPSSSFEHQNVLSLDYQSRFLSPRDQLQIPNDYSDAASTSRTSRKSLSFTGFPAKNCMHFNRGFCKNGSGCRYFHDNQSFMDHTFSSNNSDNDSDGIFSASSLEQLEIEIVDLLKSRRGVPVSITTLPMIYFDRFGKVLQAEGYLTESQRHGKAGYSLAKLLARLKNSIRVIDRFHGQHSVILAEDASKYMDNGNGRNDPGPIVSGSRQIYLTFPAESIFSKNDVADYFNSFGEVEDVRIPCQQKRMFGFVTFASSDTVKDILSQGNPHFVCGARVLVKPYREKSKFIDRKLEDIESEQNFSQRFQDMDGDLNSMPPRSYEAPRLMRKQEHEHALEVERRHFMELKFGLMSMATHDHSGISSVQRINHFLDVMNDGCSSSYNPDQGRDGYDFSECSTSSAGGNQISKAIQLQD